MLYTVAGVYLRIIEDFLDSDVLLRWAHVVPLLATVLALELFLPARVALALGDHAFVLVFPKVVPPVFRMRWLVIVVRFVAIVIVSISTITTIATISAIAAVVESISSISALVSLVSLVALSALIVVLVTAIPTITWLARIVAIRVKVSGESVRVIKSEEVFAEL